MSTDLESFNKALYDLLKVRGYDPIPLNSQNQRVKASQEADVIEFTFKKEGKDYGKVWITIDDLQNITIYYDEEQQESPNTKTPGLDYDDSWTGLLKFLKNWSQRRQMGFELANKDRLGDDMRQREYYKMKEKLGESYHPMGKKSSYNDAVPSVKIVLQHNRALEEGEARFRNISRIFLENQDGERFLAPTNKPGLARVYARHIAEGGAVNDDKWNHLKSLCEEYQKLSGFVRATRNKQFNESAQSLINEGINYYNSLRENLHRLTTRRGYQNYFESHTPALMEDGDVDLSEMFTSSSLDPRIEAAMPILSRLHKPITEMEEVDSLSEWADNVINEKLEIEETDELGEQIKGWKHAGRDIAKWRSEKDKNVKMVALKKDGKESRLSDATTTHKSEDDAVARHKRMTELNPGKKIRHNLYVDGKLVRTLGEEVEQIDEVSPKSAINAYIRRKSRADDFYSEPDDEEKAEKTLSRIDKKYGSASKIAKGARHGVEIDQKGRGHQGGPGDYLDAKQGVYKGFAKPTTKKGTKQRLDYMNLNKGRFKEEVETESLNKQQTKAGQLGPTEKAKNISPVLGKEPKQHPFKGKLVGASESKEMDPELARIIEMTKFKN